MSVSKFVCTAVGAFVLIASSAIYADSGSASSDRDDIESMRTIITTPEDPSGRCAAGGGFPLGNCEELRIQALQTGCISTDDYQALKSLGSAPVCSWNRLLSWCYCS